MLMSTIEFIKDNIMSIGIIYKNVEYEISDEDSDATIKIIENFNGTNRELEDLLENSNIDYFMNFPY